MGQGYLKRRLGLDLVNQGLGGAGAAVRGGGAVEPGGRGGGQRRLRLEIDRQGAGIEPFAEYGGQCVLPFGRHADVLP